MEFGAYLRTILYQALRRIWPHRLNQGCDRICAYGQRPRTQIMSLRDGSGSQEFQRSLNSYLRRESGDRIKDVRMSDSARDPLMQLADMCIGAITRAERERKNAARWREMLGFTDCGPAS